MPGARYARSGGPLASPAGASPLGGPRTEARTRSPRSGRPGRFVTPAVTLPLATRARLPRSGERVWWVSQGVPWGPRLRSLPGGARSPHERPRGGRSGPRVLGFRKNWLKDGLVFCAVSCALGTVASVSELYSLGFSSKPRRVPGHVSRSPCSVRGEAVAPKGPVKMEVREVPQRAPGVE